MLRLQPPVHRGPPFEELIRRRRSVRSFSDRALTLEQLGELCFATQGVTGAVAGRPLRTAPSAGATHPLALYAVARRVDGVEAGGHLYLPLEHALELVAPGDLQRRLSSAGLGQSCLVEAAVTFVIAAVPAFIGKRYGDRAARYIAMEAGHAAQNLLLAAISLGLGACPVGAFVEDEVERALGIDRRVSSALYLIPVGRPTGA
ncbi:MAG: SagB/ThcOx family dehydrogenase [Deltaproteobacteria bacterium]|nr:SagB/ThcOx family dehydrogenase [Deltaproteobacteria bacterium]